MVDTTQSWTWARNAGTGSKQVLGQVDATRVIRPMGVAACPSLENIEDRKTLVVAGQD